MKMVFIHLQQIQQFPRSELWNPGTHAKTCQKLAKNLPKNCENLVFSGFFRVFPGFSGILGVPTTENPVAFVAPVFPKSRIKAWKRRFFGRLSHFRCWKSLLKTEFWRFFADFPEALVIKCMRTSEKKIKKKSIFIARFSRWFAMENDTSPVVRVLNLLKKKFFIKAEKGDFMSNKVVNWNYKTDESNSMFNYSNHSAEHTKNGRRIVS